MRTSLLITLAAIVAALAASIPFAGGGTTAPYTVSGYTSIDFTVTGLEPGAKYEASVTFTPEEWDEYTGYEGGTNPMTVSSSGTFQARWSGEIVTGHHAGTVRMWLRPPGSYQDSPPAIGPDGNPIETTFDVP